MKLVIADTGPINYLLLIGHIDILPGLFQKVILPAAVKDELSDPDAPAVVSSWIATAPEWLEIVVRQAAMRCPASARGRPKRSR